MESAQAPIAYIVTTEVILIEEKFDRIYVAGVGPEAIFTDASRGWFVQFLGSQESICFGHTRPDLSVGDRVKITFTKEPLCPPSTSTTPTNTPNS